MTSMTGQLISGAETKRFDRLMSTTSSTSAAVIHSNAQGLVLRVEKRTNRSTTDPRRRW